MAKDFLGIGWKYPIKLNYKGNIAISKYEEDIKEAILIILGTAKGERLMRPGFGCGIHDYVFSSVNMTNLRLIENSVTESLDSWEPRIELLSVKAHTDSIDLGKLLITIDYKVRATNTQFNMVYPFYLKEGI
jgi:phage baseplate assembly protein W